MPRCPWAADDPLLRAYHDEEWGVPVHDDERHFELITLEGAQAGLSWRTVLAKRDGYRRVFQGFDPTVVSLFSSHDIDEICRDKAVVRHRQKLASVVTNANALLALQKSHASFDAYVWQFVGGVPLVNRFASLDEVPSSTELSRSLSLDLRRRGFSFVGPTTCYSYLQAAGLILDHLVSCPRWQDLGSQGTKPSR